jgi:hypothetical protein
MTYEAKALMQEIDELRAEVKRLNEELDAFSAAKPFPQQNPLSDAADLSTDRNYIAGMQVGWDFCASGNEAAYHKAIESRRKWIAEAAHGITGEKK